MDKAKIHRQHFTNIQKEGIMGTVFSTVKLEHGEGFYPFFRWAVLIAVPRDIRLKRVRDRSLQKFGSRMLPEGDLYEQEEQFLEAVAARAEDSVDKWIGALSCPVLRVDGLRPVGENMDFIVGELTKELS